MIDWIERMVRLIDAELSHGTAVRAVLAGLVCSVFLTQLLKYLPHLRVYSDRRFRWSVRVMAFGLGAFPTFVLWPEDDLVAGVIMAIVVGCVAPLGYKILVHFVPWLGDKLTARPDA